MDASNVYMVRPFWWTQLSIAPSDYSSGVSTLGPSVVYYITNWSSLIGPGHGYGLQVQMAHLNSKYYFGPFSLVKHWATVCAV